MSSPTYKAFISYKRHQSTEFARRLEFALKRYANPWLRRSGTIAVNEHDKTIDWAKTDALPPSLSEYMDAIPLYVDMTWALDRESQSPRKIR